MRYSCDVRRCSGLLIQCVVAESSYQIARIMYRYILIYVYNCMYKYIYRDTCMHIHIWIKRTPRGGLWEVIVRFAALCQE